MFFLSVHSVCSVFTNLVSLPSLLERWRLLFPPSTGCRRSSSQWVQRSYSCLRLSWLDLRSVWKNNNKKLNCKCSHYLEPLPEYHCYYNFKASDFRSLIMCWICVCSESVSVLLETLLNCFLLCSITEQWKELCAGEPGWTGFLASGIRNSHKTTPRVAAN